VIERLNMKLLLCKNVSNLGIVGDVVVVSAGYARNYLIPRRMATEPTQANMRRLAEARRAAEEEIRLQRKQLESLAERMKGAEVTIRARANEDGHLYGSVGRREIAGALHAEGFPITADHVVLPDPIRQIDTVEVEIRLAQDLRAPVKVWVVREKTAEEEAEEAKAVAVAGTEAGAHDQSAD
jgi:large subunit ribosomal protein L9